MRRFYFCLLVPPLLMIGAAAVLMVLPGLQYDWETPWNNLQLRRSSRQGLDIFVLRTTNTGFYRSVNAAASGRPLALDSKVRWPAGELAVSYSRFTLCLAWDFSP